MPLSSPRMDRLTRREVIKTFALGTAISNVIGNSWAASLLFDFRPLSHIETGMLQIKLGDFPELNNAGGSVRLGTSPIVCRSAEDVGPVGLFHPVIINRTATGFFVLHAECTHAGCTVSRANAQGIMQCPCHGSQFLADGSLPVPLPPPEVQPARQPLRRLNFTREGENLSIQLPNVFFQIKVQRVNSASRVNLSFLGFPDLTYEIYFHSSLGGPLERVNFATAPDGPLTQTELRVTNPDGIIANLYVERPGVAGFFQIAMKATVV